MGMSSGDIIGGSGEEDVSELGLGGERQDPRTSSSAIHHTTSFPVTQALVSLLAANSSLIHVAGKGKIPVRGRMVVCEIGQNLNRN